MRVVANFAILALVVCVLAGSVRSECTPKSSREIKTYVIDLDKPASQRLVQPAMDYKEQIAALIASEK